MKKVFYVMLVLVSAGLLSCGNRSNRNQNAQQEELLTETKAMPSDCDPSQGYAWSAMNGECVRLSEVGIPMVSMENPGAENMAYMFFSTDSTKVEIFVGQVSTDILDRREAAVGSVWNVKDHETKNVRKIDGNWVIEQRGVVIYRHQAE